VILLRARYKYNNTLSYTAYCKICPDQVWSNWPKCYSIPFRLQISKDIENYSNCWLF